MSANTKAPKRKTPPGIPSYLSAPPARVLWLKPSGWTVLFLLAGAGIVEMVARLHIASEATLIPATEMVVQAAGFLVNPEFYENAVIPTFVAVGVSFAISSIGGILLGYLIWRIGFARRALDPYLTAYYAVPTFALYPVLIVLFGSGRFPIIVLAAIFSIVAVVMNAMNGYDSVPPIVSKLAKSLEVSESTYFLKFFLPYALPYILIGLRLAFLYSMLSVLAAEFLLANDGLGWFVKNAYIRFNVADMYGGIVVILFVSIIAERLITLAVHRLTWIGDLK